MPVVSQIEFSNSPFEQGSGETTPYTWTPTLLAGETCTAATVKVYQYDPTYANDTLDVTATANPAGATVSASTIQVVITALTAGYEYRVQVTTVLSANHTEMRFLRVRCQI